MKRISHKIGWSRWIIAISAMLLWSWPWGKPSEQVWKHLGEFSLFIGVAVTSNLVFSWTLQKTVFDDGDALVTVFDDGDALVIRWRNNETRVPINCIQRVSWNRNMQRIKLELSAPCVLGRVISFQASQEFFPPEHNDIADDLHRRSQSSKGDDAHGIHGKEFVEN